MKKKLGTLLLLVGTWCCAGPTVDLRVFGKISVEVSENHTVLQAEDADKAAKIGGKFVADLAGFGGLTAMSDGMTFRLPDGSGFFVGRDAAEVHIVFGTSATALRENVLKADGCNINGYPLWKVLHTDAYPMWLDRFDNRAMSCGALGWGNRPHDYRAGMAWLNRLRFGLIAENNNYNLQVAPGIWDDSVGDFYAREAEKNHTLYQRYTSWASPTRPAWFWNQVPLPHVTAVEGALETQWPNRQNLSAHSRFEPIAATDDLQQIHQRELSRRCATNPAFASHFGTPELGGNFALSLPAYAASSEAVEAWREYVREVRKFSLADAGLMLRGQADAYATWQEVEAPTMRHLFQRADLPALDLRGHWQWLATDDASDQPPAADDSRWTTIHCNDPLQLLYWRYRGHVWMRRRFPVKNPGDFSHLHLARCNWHGNKSKLATVYLNGTKLENQTKEHPLTGDLDQCIALESVVKPGQNELVLDTKGDVLPFYILLSNIGRWQYPSDDPIRNRLYYAMVDFAVRYRLRGVERDLMALRAGDPEGRPLLAMAPWSLVDQTFDLFRKYGAFPHDTGQGGACWAPWMARYYVTRGMPVSSEPGGAPRDAAGMQRLITLYVLLGNDGVNLLFEPSSYQENGIGEWIDSHRELIRCIGKMEPPHGDVGVLRSVRNASRLNAHYPWSYDPSRGLLQAAGRSCNLLTLGDFVHDRAGGFYGTVMDAGTSIMTADDIAGIERFVRAGGTFIAMHHTGMHTEEVRDAWPLAKLAGLRVVNSGRGGKIRFSNSQSLWPELRGQTLPGWGQVFDWRNEESTGKSLRLQKISDAVEVVAEWVDRKPEDGNIALAVTKLGKGRILFLGSSFWRKSRDVGGSFAEGEGEYGYIGTLLDNLGVPRSSEGFSAPAMQGVFAEKWRSKNGLFDLYLAARVNTQAKAQAASPVFVGVEKPTSLFEISAAGHPEVNFTYNDGRLTLPGLDLAPMQLRVFAAPRKDLATAAAFWLESLAKRWYALPPVKRAIPKDQPDGFTLPLADGWTLVADNQAWTGETPPNAFDWASGRPVRLGAYNTMDLPDETVAHFRKVVTLPESWQGCRVSLTLAAQYWFWGVFPSGRLWLNGKRIQAFKSQPNGSMVWEVPDTGTIELILEVDGRIGKSDRRCRPSGVTGLFYLSAVPRPAHVVDVTGWQQAAEVNRLTPVNPKTAPEILYYETRFATPAHSKQPAFIESPKQLGWLMFNGIVISTPGHCRRLNVSKLLRPAGEPNLIRWWPQLCKETPSWKRRLHNQLPPMTLVW
jgi:hypothetical protein